LLRALVISPLIVAVACGFAALCYSEFAAIVPVSGSAYAERFQGHFKRGGHFVLRVHRL
jgi:amino acid transporter